MRCAGRCASGRPVRPVRHIVSARASGGLPFARGQCRQGRGRGVWAGGRAGSVLCPGRAAGRRSGRAGRGSCRRRAVKPSGCGGRSRFRGGGRRVAGCRTGRRLRAAALSTRRIRAGFQTFGAAVSPSVLWPVPARRARPPRRRPRPLPPFGASGTWFLPPLRSRNGRRSGRCAGCGRGLRQRRGRRGAGFCGAGRPRRRRGR